jgi:hypothetical protein
MERRSAFTGLLAIASIATALVAAWLVMVSVLVLPSRDPAHVAMWRMIAGAFALYSGVCGARAIGVRHPALRAAVRVLSLAAGAFGVYAIRAGGHGEGYLLLMGAILCVHAGIAIAHDLRTAVPRQPAHGA